jgi:hypothetical protein
VDEAHFRPPRPARTARILATIAAIAAFGGLIGGLRIGWVAAAIAGTGAVVLVVVAVLLSRVELIVRPSGIEVVDITGRRRQAWVGTQRLLIDFARPRPLLEIHAPGPAQAYRSTLVLAGLETAEHGEAREHLEEAVRTWAGPNVELDLRQPGGGGTGPGAG